MWHKAIAAMTAAVCLAATDGAPAPELALRDARGKMVRLSDYKGKVVLLDFWATWCTGCKTEIPWFIEFDRKYRRSGLAAIGVALDEDGWKSVKPYLKQHRDLKYRVVVGDDDVARRFQANALPLTLLIDRRGRIVFSQSGVMPREGWEKEIQRLLQVRAVR
jgi:cytochrome c biogenesis protein CcmG/thiol:disulfide interchange protein DsbE